MNVFDLQARIAIDSSDYEKGLKEASGETSRFGDVLKANLASAAIQKGIELTGLAVEKVIGTFVSMVKQSVIAYGEYEQLIGGVETLFKDNADTVQKYAEIAYKTAGLSANEYMETVTGFSASLIQSLGGDTAEAAKIADMAIIDMSDNANKMGTDMSAIQYAYQGFAKQNYTMLDNLKLGYGGTKNEMQRLLQHAEELEAQQGRTTKFSIESFSDIVQAIHIVQSEIGITGTTAEEADSTIQGSINSLKSAWENLIVGISRNDADLDTLINNVVTSAETAAENIMPVVERAVEGLKTLIDKLIPIIEEKWPDAKEKLIAFLGKVLKFFLEALGKALLEVAKLALDALAELIAKLLMKLVESFADFLKAGWDIVKNIAKGIGDKIKDVTDKGKETVQKFISKIKEFFTDLITLGGDIVLKIVSGIGDKISDAVTKAKELGDKIKENFTGAVEKAKEWGGNIVLNIKGGIDSVSDKLTTGVTNLKNSISKVWETLVNNGKTFGINFLVNFINGIAQTVSKLSDVIKQIATAIYDGIKALIDKAVTWGKDLINNFVHGIEDALSNLVSAAKNAASKIADFLGFSEPKEGPLSKFHTFAPDMMELFAKGIKDNENVVTNQIAKSFDFGQRGVAYGGANLTDMVASIANRPAGPRQMTVILELDKAQLGRAVYTLNNEETQRVGVKLAGGYA